MFHHAAKIFEVLTLKPADRARRDVVDPRELVVDLRATNAT